MNSSALVQWIVTNSILSDEVVAEILERTEGIPLFIEELTKTMLEGAGDARCSTLAVPSSLQASLLARLDRLPAAKHVAQIGSVIGREFSQELLAEVAEDTMLQGLDELVLAGLAFRRGIPPDAVYMFKHVLVQETAYSTLLRRRRQELHARIITVLEESNPEIVEQQPELLAHHCTHAGLIEKAIVYLSRAGGNRWRARPRRRPLRNCAKGSSFCPDFRTALIAGSANLSCRVLLALRSLRRKGIPRRRPDRPICALASYVSGLGISIPWFRCLAD